MKIIARTILLGCVFAAGSVFATPPVDVTVSNSGKAAFKGKTDTKGAFATGTLQPGNYVVQFNSNSAELKGKTYAIVVAAGKKKVTASVPGEKFARGGVAMKVDVGAGLNISGQVATGADGPVNKSGKKMVWIPKKTGSNMPGHWVEEDSAEAQEAKSSGTMSNDTIQRIQAHQDQHGG
jgi:hypothetical protein